MLDKVFNNSNASKYKRHRESIYESNRTIRKQIETSSLISSNVEFEEAEFLVNYFKALKQGNEDDIDFIKTVLLTDPRKTICGPLDDLRRSNMTGFGEEFPMYIAAKYNNAELLLILIKGCFK